MPEQLIILGIIVALILAIVGCLLWAAIWLIVEFGYRAYCSLTGKRYTKD